MWLRIWRIGRICAYGVYDVYGVCVHTPGGALVLAPLIWRICAYGVYCVYGVYVCIWRILRLWRMCADGVYGVYGVYFLMSTPVGAVVLAPLAGEPLFIFFFLVEQETDRPHTVHVPCA